MNRRKSRELAMQLLFSMTISTSNVEETIESYKKSCEEDISNIDFEYIEEIMNGVQSKKEELDKKIEENLKGWKLNRISNMTLTILRIAIYEIENIEDIPEKVTINEAIELSKLYCEDKAPQFVNAILDKLLKK